MLLRTFLPRAWWQAAAHVGLDEILPNLGSSHAAARKLADGLRGAGFELLSNRDPMTNLVYFSVDETKIGLDASTVVAAVATEGIQLMWLGGNQLRAVTHHQLGVDGIERTLDIVCKCVADPDMARARAIANQTSVVSAYAAGANKRIR